ncbi:MAG: N-acetylneuraminate synthase family protein, partial [Nitrospinota bacterium]
LQKAGAEEVVVLQCTSNYPPAYEDINLRAIKTMANTFDVNVGFSDHSFGIGPSIAAVALGAVVIERHFTLDKNLPGTDHRISLTPSAFSAMAKEIRAVEKALGSAQKQPAPAEKEMRRIVGRRLVAAAKIPEGKVLSREDIACKCSEAGLDASQLSLLIGKRAKTDLLLDTPLTFEFLK